jgi:hypothetical protein
VSCLALGEQVTNQYLAIDCKANGCARLKLTAEIERLSRAVQLGEAHPRVLAENARLRAALGEALILMDWLNKRGGLGLDVHARLDTVGDKVQAAMHAHETPAAPVYPNIPPEAVCTTENCPWSGKWSECLCPMCQSPVRLARETTDATPAANR